MLDVLCIGNALIDAFLTLHEANHHCRLNHETGEFCVKAGEKIPLETAQFELGGNACNVSVGLSRLGLKTSLIAEIGDDAFSNRIKKSLQDEGVDLSHFIVSHAPASFAIGINFKGDRTLFVQHVERPHNFVYEGLQAKWAYLSSMGDKWHHVYHEVPAFVKKHNIKLAFNPGTRQLEAGREALDSALAVTEILFLNREEGMELVPHAKKLEAENHEAGTKHLLTELQKMGPKIVVVTDGKKGAYVLDTEEKFYHQKNTDAPAIERTGAGDGFAAGFLAATVYGHDIQTALKWGSLNASGVIGKVGAQPGLLRKEEMERQVEKMK